MGSDAIEYAVVSPSGRVWRPIDDDQVGQLEALAELGRQDGWQLVWRLRGAERWRDVVDVSEIAQAWPQRDG